MEQPARGEGDVEVVARRRPGLVPARTPPVDDPLAVARGDRHRDAEAAAARRGVEIVGEPCQHGAEPALHDGVAARAEHEVAHEHAATLSARQRGGDALDREEVQHVRGR
ncbi:hypothetical protein [Litorihabitans aurantiacus]|uniref:hypothetical protein n=1 Tax=Litorihabitans aurantiacus TaxID=1930061 RepID=UPI0024E09CB4|nr:hypothetical protein [Litorihabitans aurantiacus]